MWLLRALPLEEAPKILKCRRDQSAELSGLLRSRKENDKEIALVASLPGIAAAAVGSVAASPALEAQSDEEYLGEKVRRGRGD